MELRVVMFDGGGQTDSSAFGRLPFWAVCRKPVQCLKKAPRRLRIWQQKSETRARRCAKTRDRRLMSLWHRARTRLTPRPRWSVAPESLWIRSRAQWAVQRLKRRSGQARLVRTLDTSRQRWGRWGWKWGGRTRTPRACCWARTIYLLFLMILRVIISFLRLNVKYYKPLQTLLESSWLLVVTSIRSE